VPSAGDEVKRWREASVDQTGWVGGFDDFVAEVRPRLVRAFVPQVGVADAADAAAEAVAYAFEHWETLRLMANPAGYLYRVGRSRVRRRRVPQLPRPAAVGVPEVEPDLIPALLSLPESQRTAVWLVYACQWRYAEVAEAMGTSTSMVGNHVTRGLDALRRRMGVEVYA
jgi:DNA-directed RNA polymerase specialized sigma24 family protein